MSQVLLIVVFLILILGVVPVLVIRIKKRGDESLNKLKSMIQPYTDADYFRKLERDQAMLSADFGERKQENLFQKLSATFGKLFLMEKYQEKLLKKLARAGMKWKPSEFIFLKFCIGVGAMLFGLIFLRSLIWMLGFGFIGWLFPDIIVWKKTGARIKAFNDQLVDALVMMSNSMKAGYSFLQALDLVARESHYPMNDEFKRVLRETGLGAPIEDSFAGLLDRVPSEDLDLVLTVVMIQRQIGGNLAEILDKIAHTIRERIKLLGQIQALTAQGRMSGIVITALPFALYFIMHLLEPEKMSTLYKEKVGWVLIAIGLIMQSIGAVAIKKIISIEV
ncbi:MAG: type II secretion system F family protein [Candidatus Hydrogenedentota bacterium]